MDLKAVISRIAGYQAQQDFSAALACVDEAIVRLPSDLNLTTKKGIVLRQLNRFSESVALLSDLATANPQDLGAKHELALSLRLAGDHAQSLALSDAILQVNPLHRGSLLARIDTNSLVKDFSAALACVDEAIARLPGDMQLATKRGIVLRQLNRFDESVALLSQLVAANPHDLGAKHELALSLRLAGDHAQSLALSDAILQVNPLHRGSLLARIDTNAFVQDFSSALAGVDDAIARLPGDLQLTIKRGIVLRLLNRLDESVALLSDLVAANPYDLGAKHELALSLRLAGDHAQSLALSDAILRVNPLHRGALFSRIDTAAHTQDFQKVLTLLDDAIALFINNPDALHDDVLSHCSIVALRMNGSVLARNPQIWNHLSGNLDKLTSDQILIIYDACSFWDDAPEDCQEILVKSLLDRSQLTVSTCENLINRLHSSQPADLASLGNAVVEKSPVSERGYLKLYLSALLGSSQRVLSQRKDCLPKPRRVRDNILVLRLVKQAGRIQVAERYSRLLITVNPNHPSVRSLYLQSLFETGNVQEAEKLLDSILETNTVIPVHLAGMVFDALVKLDRLEDVDLLFDTHPSQGNLPTFALYQIARAKQSLGKAIEADKLLADIQIRASSASMLHSAPSIVQNIQTESRPSAHEELYNQTRKLTNGVTSTIRTAARASGPIRQESRNRPEKFIHQYWDKPGLPPDILTLTQSWKKDETFQYQLYDRRLARRILRDKLGPDWSRAFCNASSPAEESDFFRLCILMLRGGIYVDCDDRLSKRLVDLYEILDGFTIFAEPFGFTGNNFLACPKGHPLVAHAAACAKFALESRHKDNTWFKTGPGLLSRIVCSFLNARDSDDESDKVTVYPWHILSRFVQFHVPLPYKKTEKYWNSSKVGFINDAIAKELRARSCR